MRDHPNFQLAQLVYGDLLTARARPLRALGDVPEDLGGAWRPGTGRPARGIPAAHARAARAPAGRRGAFAVPAAVAAQQARDRHRHLARAAVPVREHGRRPEAGGRLLHLGGQARHRQGGRRRPAHAAGRVLRHQQPRPEVAQGLLRRRRAADQLSQPVRRAARQDRRRHLAARHAAGAVRARRRRPPTAAWCWPIPTCERIIRTVEIRTTPVVIAPSLRWVARASLQAETARFADALAGLARRQRQRRHAAGCWRSTRPTSPSTASRWPSGRRS